MRNISQVREFVQDFHKVFTKPSCEIFSILLNGWILCPSRRFVTSIFSFGDFAKKHAHDAYHRFFRDGAWLLSEFFHALAILVVNLAGNPDFLYVLGDDTVHKKTGRKVDGAKTCRDAVKSTKQKVIYAWGLQIVLLCLLVHPPWGGEPLALPINMRLYRKRPSKNTGKSILDLMWEMLVDIRTWFPGREIVFIGDGFYASLAGKKMDKFHLISRLRRDAALYRKAKKNPPGKRGPKPTKGERLPSPEEIATTKIGWKLVETVERGKKRTRLVLVRHVLWHKVRKASYIRLVISRDPLGIENDDFFFTTDLQMEPGFLISMFSDRWPIEDTFRNCKQYLGIEQPQSYKSQGPEKVAAIGYAVYSLVWSWFIQRGDYTSFPDRPWYSTKTNPSFLDALAQTRHQIWLEHKYECVHNEADLDKFNEFLIESLDRAA